MDCMDTNPSEAAFAVIEAARGARTPEALADIYGPAFARLGLSDFALAEGMRPGGIISGRSVLGRVRPAWAQHYMRSGHAARDPMVARALRASDPFRWSDIPVQDPDARRVLDEAAEFGIRDGFVLPIHHLDGSMWGVSLGSENRLDLGPEDFAALHLMALYFGAQAERLTRVLPPDPKRPRLTARQRECLQWARYGKTDWEISEILSLSHGTVIDHMAAARRRLGVHTRTQAVIEALALGLIAL